MRRWATAASAIDCATDPSATRMSFSSERLGVIFRAYAVYLDLLALRSRCAVITKGEPDRFDVRGRNVAHEEWFSELEGSPWVTNIPLET